MTTEISTSVTRPVAVELTPPSATAWSPRQSAELYQIQGWGEGFFAINDKGHVTVRPDRSPQREVDLYDVVAGLEERGIQTPVLLAFNDLLATRIRDIHDAFRQAIKENEYRGRFCSVYPIKANQQYHLVEQLMASGQSYDVGLEAGSKPELLAVLGLTADGVDRLIVCNGFKEERYIRHVMLATKLGRRIIPVIENIRELELILEQAQAYGVRPRIGVRINLSVKGAGRWRHSSGSKAKFGLTIPSVLEVVQRLRKCEMLDCLQLVHCHMGSQIHDIKVVNAGVSELARLYVELVKLGAGLKYVDIGGGLGVDYHGSQTRHEFSTNYSLCEYAGNVVYRLMAVCDDAHVPHPTIVTESGRAMVSHQSVLVFNVVSAHRLDDYGLPRQLEKTFGRVDVPRPLEDLLEACQNVCDTRMLECFHDATQAHEEALTLFNFGHLSLEQRGLADRLFWATCLKIRRRMRKMKSIPEELLKLEYRLSDTYFCNLSVFQSLPDIWAIDQVFPMLPIHRLNEEPTREGTLADLTCDSDGKIDHFVARQDVRQSLRLHELRDGEPYYLAAFLVGAYQETLGDLHNLFGDTNVVHIKMDQQWGWSLEQVVEGDTVKQVLGYLQYDVNRLYQAIRHDCERSVRAGRMTISESRMMLSAYQRGLAGYTYLE